jgi:diadenosine tetraphosphate (Ap4A) HIT family hydrolase
MTIKFVSELPCQLCEYVAGRLPCEMLYDGKEVFVLLNATARARGAVVIFPKRHVRSFLWATPSELAELNAVIRSFTSSIIASFSPEALHSWCSTGCGAGQTEAHMHFQLAPRYAAASYSFARSGQLQFAPIEQRKADALRLDAQSRVHLESAVP